MTGLFPFYNITVHGGLNVSHSLFYLLYQFFVQCQIEQANHYATDGVY